MNTAKTILYITIMLIFSISQALSSESNTVCGIKFINGRLSINVENMALDTVVKELHKETGIEFVLSKDCADTKISAKLQALPLKKVLSRLLTKLSYAIIETDERIERVIISNNSTLNNTILAGMEVDTSNTIPPGMEVAVPNTRPKGMKTCNSTLNTIPAGMEADTSNTIPPGMEVAVPNTRPKGM